MESMHAVKRRIRSIENTRQITRSMKLVAASKLRRTQSLGRALGDYAIRSREMLSAVLASPGKNENPYLRPASGRGRVMYVLFVGNRGLCGTYNHAVLKYMRELAENDEREIEVVVCGSWGGELIAAAKLNVVRTFGEISDTPSAPDAAELTDYLKNAFVHDGVDEVILVYQKFNSVLSQSPTHSVLFPIAPSDSVGSTRQYIFEPDRASLLDSLVELYIGSTVYSTLLEARTGEHASRMTAMTAAADNTEALIAELNLKLNHARQSAITTEISEIEGGTAGMQS